MLYDTHYKEGKKVTFKKFDLNLAGLLFLPPNFEESKKYPAIVITHPGGGVKEQCSSLYGWDFVQVIRAKAKVCQDALKIRLHALKTYVLPLIILLLYLILMKKKSEQWGFAQAAVTQ